MEKHERDLAILLLKIFAEATEMADENKSAGGQAICLMFCIARDATAKVLNTLTVPLEKKQ